jgi:hypothetical protein
MLCVDAKCVLSLRGRTKIAVVLKQIFGPQKNETSEQHIYIYNEDARIYVYVVFLGQ